MGSKAQTAYHRIRDARPEDLSALARLHVETFLETHGSSPGAPTYTLRENQWRQILGSCNEEDFCVVIELANGDLAGFARGVHYKHAEHLTLKGELNKIYILKKFHRLGMGTGLIAAVASRFLSQGIESMLLFGSADNPSNAFYEALGAEKIFANNGEFHGGYGWIDLKKLMTLIRTRLI